MSYKPTDIFNQVLDAIGNETTIGDAEEGSREARVILRAYWTCLRQLLRAAPWDWARKQAPLFMLADATGTTQNVGTVVPQGFNYEYAWPTDCAKLRFVPKNNFFPGALGNYSDPSIWNDGLSINPPIPLANQPAVPPTQGPPARRLRPARFIVISDANYPPPPGSVPAEGVGQQGRTVILTDVYNATAVYTENVLEPTRWDHLFRAALVAFIASEVSLPLSKDKKFGLTLRQQQVMIAKSKVAEARVANGNEAWNQNDIPVDWIDVRRGRTGDDPYFGPFGERIDWDYYSAYDSLSFANGDVL